MFGTRDRDNRSTFTCHHCRERATTADAHVAFVEETEDEIELCGECLQEHTDRDGWYRGAPAGIVSVG